jgi:ubiquitin-conjugating enzyme E2 J2
LFRSKNCPHFRKLFPEYVEKYNQQQEMEQTAAEPEPQDNPAPAPAVQEAAALVNNVGKPVVEGRGEKKQKTRLPFWLMVLIVSVFGAVMALPLMQL